jgi:hypothetical protein
MNTVLYALRWPFAAVLLTGASLAILFVMVACSDTDVFSGWYEQVLRPTLFEWPEVK